MVKRKFLAEAEKSQAGNGRAEGANGPALRLRPLVSPQHEVAVTGAAVSECARRKKERSKGVVEGRRWRGGRRA